MFWGLVRSIILFFIVNFKFMDSSKLKKNLTTEISEQLRKSKISILSNENDFLVKNLRKAG